MGGAGRKLGEMESSLAGVHAEVASLDERKAALLSQLAQVDALLAQAHARKVSLPCLGHLHLSQLDQGCVCLCMHCQCTCGKASSKLHLAVRIEAAASAGW